SPSLRLGLETGLLRGPSVSHPRFGPGSPARRLSASRCHASLASRPGRLPSDSGSKQVRCAALRFRTLALVQAPLLGGSALPIVTLRTLRDGTLLAPPPKMPPALPACFSVCGARCVPAPGRSALPIVTLRLFATGGFPLPRAGLRAAVRP